MNKIEKQHAELLREAEAFGLIVLGCVTPSKKSVALLRRKLKQAHDEVAFEEGLLRR